MAGVIQRARSTVQGLQAFTYVVPAAGPITFQGTLQLPNVVPSAVQGAGGGAGTGSGGGAQVNSQVIVTITQNGTQRLQTHVGDRGFLLDGLSCAANDVIVITPSSSLSQDQQPNSVQMSVQIFAGTI